MSLRIILALLFISESEVFAEKNRYKCTFKNWHRYMDRRPRCREKQGQKVCDCEDRGYLIDLVLNFQAF